MSRPFAFIHTLRRSFPHSYTFSTSQYRFTRMSSSSAAGPTALPASSSRFSFQPRYIDIGINLTDPVYDGVYHGTRRHPSDLPAVIQRAKESGCLKLIVTGSDLKESRKAVELAKEYPGIIYNTIGVHPCSSSKFTAHSSSSSVLLSQLRALAKTASSAGQCVAFGEIGLDYDRLGLCPKEAQLISFAAQLDLATELNLPLFLHSRAAHEDFLRLLEAREEKLPKRGVVHSFTGTIQEMQDLVGRGWSIGVNGCSLKTQDNLDVVKAIPLENLMLETDGPWCEIRASHASSELLKKNAAGKGAVNGESEERWKCVKKEKWVEGAMVKGRNEPCTIGKVAEAVAAVKGLSLDEVTEAAWRNTVKMFGLGEEGEDS